MKMAGFHAAMTVAMEICPLHSRNRKVDEPLVKFRRVRVKVREGRRLLGRRDLGGGLQSE
jgi:hypothetical protein